MIKLKATYRILIFKGLLILFFGKCSLFAQYSTVGIDVEETKITEMEEEIQLIISLDKKNWIYTIGEEPVFTVRLLGNGVEINESVEASYTMGLEKMKPIREEHVNLTNGVANIVGEPLGEPGFLRCEVRVKVNGKIYKATATAAFDPEKIKPTAVEPVDFDRYWSDAIENSKHIPLSPKLTPIPDRGNDSIAVYQVEYGFYNDGAQKFYGVLSTPKKEGKYPATIRFPGAGHVPPRGDQATAAKGFITLSLYIHGHPVIKEKSYYANLRANELKGYQYEGVADRDSFYYKNVILGCVRSVDLIYSLPQFDGNNIGSWGSSQGGALSIITTSLDNRINYFVALCPAMCDFTGYLHNRAGGWPHIFAKPERYKDNKEEIIEALSYYDVVNFAKHLKVPGFFSWGFNDPVTPPTSFYAAYNMIKSSKQVHIIPEGVHKIYREQWKITSAWLIEKLKQ